MIGYFQQICKKWFKEDLLLLSIFFSNIFLPKTQFLDRLDDRRNRFDWMWSQWETQNFFTFLYVLYMYFDTQTLGLGNETKRNELDIQNFLLAHFRLRLKDSKKEKKSLQTRKKKFHN